MTDETNKLNALRYNDGKPRMSLLPSQPLIEIAKVLTYGSQKYESHNWRRGFNWTSIIDSLERHLAAWKEGEDYDAESGLLHLAHVGCNILFLLEHQVHNIGVDDRFKVEKQYGKNAVPKDGKITEEEVKRRQEIAKAAMRHLFPDTKPMPKEGDKDEEMIKNLSSGLDKSLQDIANKVINKSEGFSSDYPLSNMYAGNNSEFNPPQSSVKALTDLLEEVGKSMSAALHNDAVNFAENNPENKKD